MSTEGIYRQARDYGMRLRNSGPSRVKLEQSMRHGSDSNTRLHNDGLRDGWERRDEELRQAKEWRK